MKLTAILILLALTTRAQTKWCDKDSNHPLCICSKNPHHPVCCCVPVELKSFTVRDLGLFAGIEVQVASEENNAFYTLYRSPDGFNWEEVTTWQGRGTTNTPITLKFEDKDNVYSKVYYKLTQTDYDGTIDQLGVVYIDLRFSLVEGFKVKGKVYTVEYYGILGVSSSSGLKIIKIVTSQGVFTYKVL